MIKLSVYYILRLLLMIILVLMCSQLWELFLLHIEDRMEIKIS